MEALGPALREDGGVVSPIPCSKLAAGGQSSAHKHQGHTLGEAEQENEKQSTPQATVGLYTSLTMPTARMLSGKEINTPQ